ncbi:hypothetical protein A3K73_04400 [Candidatus Pacearchaeota archaeon RBG_13_36_9]|nr:MAG: hypothetical protein A3K73_04400 [Candidatus Pacearchaeota archaeon RBG_13_36_9]
MIKKISLLLISFISLLSLASAQQSNNYCGGFGGMMTGTYGYGGTVFGWAFGVLSIAALGLFTFWLIKQLQKK